MLDQFNRHPHSIGETYGEHLGGAFGFGAAMVVAGLACMVHALLPFLFETAASDCVERLHRRMGERRAQALQGRAGMASTSAV
jgi:hypothetical protein